MGPRDPFGRAVHVMDDVREPVIQSSAQQPRPAAIAAGALVGAAFMLVGWVIGWAAAAFGVLGAAAGAGAVMLWRVGRRHLNPRAAWKALVRGTGDTQGDEHEAVG